MKKMGFIVLFDYWFILIELKFKCLCYVFELKFEIDIFIYVEWGFFFSILNDDVGNFFCFLFIYVDDVFKVLFWIKDIIWY